MIEFKLLKDLPGIKAGDIFIKDPQREFFTSKSTGYSYKKCDVENNPEWFEEIKEKVKLRIKPMSILSCGQWKRENTLVYKCPEQLPFSDIEVKLMEDALNGKLIRNPASITLTAEESGLGVGSENSQKCCGNCHRCR